MKKAILAIILLLALGLLSGCDAVTQALGKLGDDMEAAYIQEAKPGSGDNIDWSFVPVVRDLAVDTFMQGFPDAEIVQTSVASRSGTNDRVIVTISYRLGEKSGNYGFDYALQADGTYELTRYGEGVKADDL